MGLKNCVTRLIRGRKSISMTQLTFFCRDVEADEEIVVNNIGRTTILDNEAGPPQEMVVLLNTQEKFQQPNGKISLA